MACQHADRNILNFVLSSHRPKHRSRYASLICTHSSQSARTHPTLASSEGPRGRRVPSSAALTAEEEEEEVDAQRE